MKLYNKPMTDELGKIRKERDYLRQSIVDAWKKELEQRGLSYTTLAEENQQTIESLQGDWQPLGDNIYQTPAGRYRRTKNADGSTIRIERIDD